MSQIKLHPETEITVCDKCFKASCWQGIFMCNESRTAGTVNMTVAALNKLRVEHPSYWPASRVIKDGLDDGPYLPGMAPRKKAEPKTPEELRAIRAKAWATRKARKHTDPTPAGQPNDGNSDTRGLS